MKRAKKIYCYFVFRHKNLNIHRPEKKRERNGGVLRLCSNGFHVDFLFFLCFCSLRFPYKTNKFICVRKFAHCILFSGLARSFQNLHKYFTIERAVTFRKKYWRNHRISSCSSVFSMLNVIFLLFSLENFVFYFCFNV